MDIIVSRCTYYFSPMHSITRNSNFKIIQQRSRGNVKVFQKDETEWHKQWQTNYFSGSLRDIEIEIKSSHAFHFSLKLGRRWPRGKIEAKIALDSSNSGKNKTETTSTRNKCYQPIKHTIESIRMHSTTTIKESVISSRMLQKDTNYVALYSLI